MKYSGKHNKRPCPDHRQTFAANNSCCVCVLIFLSTVVCVCAFFQLILGVKLVGRTSRGHTGFIIHLPSAVRAFIFLARKIQPFLSLVDREVGLRKNPSLPGFELTAQRVRGLRGYQLSYREKKRKEKKKKLLTVV